MPNKKISQLSDAAALTGGEHLEILQGGVNLKVTPQQIANYVGAGITREFNRAFSETLLFDKNEIFYAIHELTGDVSYTLAGSGNLVNQTSSIRHRIITDGTHAISFGDGFDFIYGISNGEILEAGNYEIYFLFENGSVVVNVPGVSQQSSGLTQLQTPSDFAVIADGENALDMTWTDVANEIGYQIERSLTGTGGWTLYSSPVADATSDTETGLNPGETIFYRIKALGDGVTYSDSPYTIASGTTESSGDVTAPVPTFLPANGNAVWTVNKPLTITMDEDIRDDDGVTAVTSANAADYIVLKQTNSGGADIPKTVTYNPTTRTFTITPVTTYGTNQLVYLAIDGIEDINGNEMSLQSITFTTTEYTYHNGTSNRLIFGDILDGVIAINDTNFWLERTLNNPNMSGSRVIWSKFVTSTDCSFRLYYNGTTVVFFFSMTGGTRTRAIVWENTDMAAGENIVVLKYDGTQDTNDGLDRCQLLINGVLQTGSFVSNPTGALSGQLVNTAANLALDNDINGSGTPVSTLWYEGEAKNAIIRSGAGAVVELNVPIERLGTDTSGNGRNGTWV